MQFISGEVNKAFKIMPSNPRSSQQMCGHGSYVIDAVTKHGLRFLKFGGAHNAPETPGLMSSLRRDRALVPRSRHYHQG